MSESSSNETAGPRFQISHTMFIDDVASKVEMKELVKSTFFFCRHDPRAPAFELQIQFSCWGPPSLYLVPYFVPLDRNVHLTSLKLSILDDEDGHVEIASDSWTARKGSQSEVRNSSPFELNTLCPFPIIATEQWKVVCDVGYVILPEVNSKPVQNVTLLQRDFLKLLNTDDRADVTFVVQGETIKAHKIILMARCTHFERMFNSEMVESDSNRVIITDVRPEVFREMLKYLYASQQPQYQDDVAMDLLSAADKYGLEDLAKRCETAICRHLTADNVIDALILAERCNRTELMAAASAVFRSEALELKENGQWDKMMDNPELLAKLLEFCLVF